jgi:hypothetical protein
MVAVVKRIGKGSQEDATKIRIDGPVTLSALSEIIEIRVECPLESLAQTNILFCLS